MISFYLVACSMSVWSFETIKAIIKDCKNDKTSRSLYFLYLFATINFFVISLVGFIEYSNTIELVIYCISILIQSFVLSYIFLHHKSFLNLFNKNK